MLHRFKKITDGLYRGSAPSPADVKYLQEQYGIRKIVSLDEEASNRIDRICKLLGIEHLNFALDGSKKSLIHLISQDLKKLLIDGGPTYFHCKFGKDRTGFLAALFKCKYMGVKPEAALKEARALGFGIGVSPEIIKVFENIIKSCKSVGDENNADIVSNERDYKSDNRDSFLDEAHQGSFSPYLSETRQYPYDYVYNPINDQSPTRENYKKEDAIKQHDLKKDDIPMVGNYDNAAGLFGAGPVFPAGGFISD